MILNAYEIEHEGDMEHAESILRDLGAKITYSEPNFEAEFCEYHIDLPEGDTPGSFRKKLEDTDWI